MTVDTTAPIEWDELPPPADLPPDTITPEATPDTGPTCPTCGEVVIRDPSWKRMHKYHDGCAPQSHHSSGESRTGTGKRRTSTGSRAEKEADRCEEILKGFFVKAALAVSVVDRFDAFVIMVNAQAVCTSFRALVLRYDDLRKEFLKVPEGGSIFGIIISVAFMALPIAAHHGLIPSKRIASMMINAPVMMYKLMQRVGEGEDGLRTMMDEYQETLKREREQAAAKARTEANGSFVGPSAN